MTVGEYRAVVAYLERSTGDGRDWESADDAPAWMTQLPELEEDL